MSNFLGVTGRLSLDGSGWEKGLRKAESGVNRFAGNTLGGLKSQIAGAFTVGAIVAFTKSIIDLGGQIKDTSVRLGISTDAVQKFSFAANQTGSSIDAVASGMEKIAKAQEDIRRGGGDNLIKSFSQFGISLHDIKTLSPEELFQKMGEALAGVTVDGQTAAAALEILGKSGGKLLPVLKELQENSKRAPLISEEDIELLDNAGDQIDYLLLKLKVLATNATVGQTNPMAENLFKFFAQDSSEMSAVEKVVQKWTAKAFGVDLESVKGKSLPDKSGDKPAVSRPITDDMEDRAKLQSEINKLEFDNLSTEEKLVELEKQKLKLQQDFWDAVAGSNDELRARIGMEKSSDQIAALTKGKPESKPSKGSLPATDSLVSVGNFLGAGAGMIQSIQQKQVQHLSSIDRSMKTLVQQSGVARSGWDLSQVVPPL